MEFIEAHTLAHTGTNRRPNRIYIYTAHTPAHTFLYIVCAFGPDGECERLNLWVGAYLAHIRKLANLFDGSRSSIRFELGCAKESHQRKGGEREREKERQGERREE